MNPQTEPRWPAPIRVYTVGGAVRDRLLGHAVQDRDFVVVGATPEDMTARGFHPVGKDFPVFLHPRTQEEFALARTERKSGRGYKGFVVHASPDVSLEEDLKRRDLTINAMAEDENGQITDPYGGQRDLHARILRHVSEAFVEDPVRILRVARFAARFPDFQIAQETQALMTRMVENGEVDALVPERIWHEIARGLMTEQPSRMFEVLRDCRALARLLPELDRLFGIPQNPKHHPEIDTGVHVMRVIDEAAHRKHTLPVRWAALLHDLGKGETPTASLPNHGGHENRGVPQVAQINQRLRVPSECGSLARLVCQWHGLTHQASQLGLAGLMDLLEKTDALRRPQRFMQFLQACEDDFHGRPGYELRPFPQATRLLQALEIVRGVDAGRVATQVSTLAGVPAAIRAARLAALQENLPETA